MTASVMSQALLCTKHPILQSNPLISKPGYPRRNLQFPRLIRKQGFENEIFVSSNRFICEAARKNTVLVSDPKKYPEEESVNKALQIALWAAEVVYILWLFLLPYAPGDPVWAISSETINYLVGLSLNFFFILPFLNVVGINLVHAPVLHPMSEGLFNFVIGWTFMFAPLLFTDRKRDSYKGSLDILWGFQMFLTNTFLIPYMAIRLNDSDTKSSSTKPSQLASVMTKGAPTVGLIGGAICLISILWALFGRMEGNFGSLTDRLDFLTSYLGSERIAPWMVAISSIWQRHTPICI